MVSSTEQGQRAVIRAGREEGRINARATIEISGNERPGQLVCYSEPGATGLLAETNKQSTMVISTNRITCADGQRKLAKPFFLVFTDQTCYEDWLVDLGAISLMS